MGDMLGKVTTVESWNVLAGPTAQTLTPVRSSPRTGFETAIGVSTSAHYLAVQAVGSSGEILGTPSLHEI
jgi:hypothetical protein